MNRSAYCRSVYMKSPNAPRCMQAYGMILDAKSLYGEPKSLCTGGYLCIERNLHAQRTLRVERKTLGRGLGLHIYLGKCSSGGAAAGVPLNVAENHVAHFVSPACLAVAGGNSHTRLCEGGWKAWEEGPWALERIPANSTNSRPHELRKRTETALLRADIGRRQALWFGQQLGDTPALGRVGDLPSSGEPEPLGDRLYRWE